METAPEIIPESVKALRKSFWDGQEPEIPMEVSDWADKYRHLSSVSSPEPGIWRTDRTPYLREIMNCLSSKSMVTEVVFMKGSQIGGTEVGLNFLGYLVDQCPGPAMMIQPTDIAAKKFSKQRIDKLFKESPRLQKKVRAQKSRDSSNTVLVKEYDGGLLVITGANSASALRSMPMKYLIADEIDAYVLNVGSGEGDPVKLAEVRARNQPRRKIFKLSSPTVDGRSRIKAAFEQTDKRYYYVPCPFCDTFQKLEWKQIRWVNGDAETAHLECISCRGKILEQHKTKMLAQGKWIAENKTPASKAVGFHLSALYSPVGWYSWAQAVKEFLEACHDELKLRVFVNTALGETWKAKGDAPEWERLYERREFYSLNIVPPGGLFLTAGIDVQKDRFEVEIVAWGSDKQSWSVDYRTIEADTDDITSYERLNDLLNESWPMHENPKCKLSLRQIAIDSGYNTSRVYEWSKNKKGKVIAVKGSDSQPSLVGKPKHMEVGYAGQRVKRGVMVWPVGVSIAKTELYGWLNLKKPISNAPFPPGYCHFPQYDDEYFKMLTAEEIVVRRVRGFNRYQWEKTRARNEALDARVYARAAACVVGLDRFTDSEWNEMKDAVKLLYNEGGAKKTTTTKSGIPIKPSSFL